MAFCRQAAGNRGADEAEDAGDHEERGQHDHPGVAGLRRGLPPGPREGEDREEDRDGREDHGPRTPAPAALGGRSPALRPARRRGDVAALGHAGGVGGGESLGRSLAVGLVEPDDRGRDDPWACEAPPPAKRADGERRVRWRVDEEGADVAGARDAGRSPPTGRPAAAIGRPVGRRDRPIVGAGDEQERPRSQSARPRRPV